MLRRGFDKKKNSKVLIVEDVITTGKSSLECERLIENKGATTIGFCCIIDRSDKKKLKIKSNKILSHIKINIPTFSDKKLPYQLKIIKPIKPGSRFLNND